MVAYLPSNSKGDLLVEWMFLPLKRYADFDGRSRRMEFWMFQLFQWAVYFIWFILFFVFAGVTAAVTEGAATTGEEQAIGVVALLLMGVIFLFALAMFIPNIAVTVRRFHDQDQSGWLCLINLIPLGGLVVLVFMLLEGTRGPNQYGEDPKGPGVDPSTFS